MRPTARAKRFGKDCTSARERGYPSRRLSNSWSASRSCATLDLQSAYCCLPRERGLTLPQSRHLAEARRVGAGTGAGQGRAVAGEREGLAKLVGLNRLQLWPLDAVQPGKRKQERSLKTVAGADGVDDLDGRSADLDRADLAMPGLRPLCAA